MTELYIPKYGERVRITKVHPQDPTAVHSRGKVCVVRHATESITQRGWLYLMTDCKGGTWCLVQPAGAFNKPEDKKMLNNFPQKGDRVKAFGCIGTVAEPEVKIHVRHNRYGSVVDLDDGRRVVATMREMSPQKDSRQLLISGVVGFALVGLAVVALVLLSGCSSLKAPTTPKEVAAYCAAIDQARADAARYAEDEVAAEAFKMQLDEMAEGYCQ